MRLGTLRHLNFLGRLARSRSGLATIEFAISAPVIVLMGLAGAEIAYMATTNMKVSQLAVSLADNASRLGQTDNSGVTPTISEDDIDSIMAGAIEEGQSIDFENKGRVILTSLERDSATGKQYIHWQRCRGELDKDSRYGNDTTANGLNGPVITGLGASGEITARPNSAVMFVEVFYDHDGLLDNAYSMPAEFHEEAAFVIRDDRNLAPGVTGNGGNSQC